MAKKYRIGVIEGDGIGPEIVSATLHILNSLPLNFEYIRIEAGYTYYKKSGRGIEEDFIDKTKELDAILKGPLYTPPGTIEFKSVNVLIRRELDLYVNIRPFKSYRGISLKNFNIVIVRENLEDVYVGIEGKYDGTAIALRIISERETERVAEYAFRYAEEHGFKKVAVVHKANILKISDGLFRDVFFRVAKKHPNIVANEIIVDTAAYTIVKSPENMQILVTPNLYGDILSDLLAGMVGSLGLCGSAQIGEKIGVFEPVHGVAFDIAGRGIANPIGEILSAKMMLEYLGSKHGDHSLILYAKKIDEAIKIVIEEKKLFTQDLGGSYKTMDIANAIIDIIKNL